MCVAKTASQKWANRFKNDLQKIRDTFEVLPFEVVCTLQHNAKGHCLVLQCQIVLCLPAPAMRSRVRGGHLTSAWVASGGWLESRILACLLASSQAHRSALIDSPSLPYFPQGWGKPQTGGYQRIEQPLLCSLAGEHRHRCYSNFEALWQKNVGDGYIFLWP